MIPRYDFITAVKFASHAAGKQDVRYYLNGVLFRFINDTLILVGCDGHRIAEVRIDLPVDLDLHGDYIIDNDSIKTLLAAMKTKRSDESVIEIAETDDLQLTVHGNGQTVVLKAIDGKFPDYARNLPGKDTEGAPELGINAVYLAEAAAALKPLANRGYRGIKLSSWDAMTPLRLECPTDHGEFRQITKLATVHIMPMRL